MVWIWSVSENLQKIANSWPFRLTGFTFSMCAVSRQSEKLESTVAFQLLRLYAASGLLVLAMTQSVPPETAVRGLRPLAFIFASRSAPTARTSPKAGPGSNSARLGQALLPR